VSVGAASTVSWLRECRIWSRADVQLGIPTSPNRPEPNSHTAEVNGIADETVRVPLLRHGQGRYVKYPVKYTACFDVSALAVSENQKINEAGTDESPRSPSW